MSLPSMLESPKVEPENLKQCRTFSVKTIAEILFFKQLKIHFIKSIKLILEFDQFIWLYISFSSANGREERFFAAKQDWKNGLYSNYCYSKPVT